MLSQNLMNFGPQMA